MQRSLGSLVAACLLAALGAPAFGQGIYTCVDSKGRRLTSDRPIVDCIDREQAEISPGGQVVRRIGPSLTAEERAAEDEKARRAAEERNRVLDEKRRDRVLLARYPDRATHDKERTQALENVDEVIKTASKRIAELNDQRRKLDLELEFYKGDPAKAPPLLRRQMDENEHQLAAQSRFVQNQEEEKKRVNARYDQELERLRHLWVRAMVPGVAAASAALPASAASAKRR